MTSLARGSRSMPGTWWKSETAPAPMIPYRTLTRESSFTGREVGVFSALFRDASSTAERGTARKHPTPHTSSAQLTPCSPNPQPSPTQEPQVPRYRVSTALTRTWSRRTWRRGSGVACRWAVSEAGSRCSGAADGGDDLAPRGGGRCSRGATRASEFGRTPPADEQAITGLTTFAPFVSNLMSAC